MKSLSKASLLFKYMFVVIYVIAALMMILLQQILMPSVLYGVFPDNKEIDITPVGRLSIVITYYNDPSSSVSSVVATGFIPVLHVTPANMGDVVFVRGYGLDWIITVLSLLGLGVLSLTLVRVRLELLLDRVVAIVVLVLTILSLASYMYYTVAVESTPIYTGRYSRVADRPFDKVNITGVGSELGVLDFFNGSYLINLRTNASVIAFYTPGVGLAYWQGSLGSEGLQYLSKYFNFTQQTYVLIEPWNSTVYYSRIEFARGRSGLEGLTYLTLSTMLMVVSVIVGFLRSFLGLFKSK